MSNTCKILKIKYYYQNGSEWPKMYFKHNFNILHTAHVINHHKRYNINMHTLVPCLMINTALEKIDYNKNVL